MCNIRCAKNLLFAFNFVFWLAGVTLLSFGVSMRVHPTIVRYLEVLDIGENQSQLLLHAANIFIVGGACMLVIGALGCCGAIREQQAALFVYATLLLIIMVFEITAAILVAVYRTKVGSALQSEMKSEIKGKYLPGKKMQSLWDEMQKQMRCCGATSYHDYMGSAWQNETRRNGSSDVVPLSCCATDTEHKLKNVSECQSTARVGSSSDLYLQQKGCYDAIMTWCHHHTMAMMILGFLVGAIQVFGFVAACCLRKAISRPDDKAA